MFYISFCALTKANLAKQPTLKNKETTHMSSV